MSRPFVLNDAQKKCPCCDHTFMVINPTQWLYKTVIKGNWVYYCRYNCWRHATLDLDNTKQKNREAYLRRINGRKQNGQPQNV